ncbi:alanyl-tRNA editing protein Aarsd1 isoform X2 [Electrophorus electricus]|uniref:Threonyl/alanyl tRNA synthetase SAD domain-containing protein n=1 Tax=Electrophorus electricus TaxID=8005 RepID=A0A4W4E0Q5_ELEEL|nr:alanyl-tRNA editing protein Aarsd1 isoform X2 [Electrophorus electricus]
MAFQCQRDSYMKEFVTSVVSCLPAEIKLESNGKREKVTGFNVVLKDTILFPEGGGQPDDHGTIESWPVLQVTRQGPEALHFITSALTQGQEVLLKVDWERRFDHMQQHSGQHLITALADSMFEYKTTSWELGRHRSSIELDTATVKPGEMEALESVVNEKIRAHIPVSVQFLSIDDPAVEKVIKILGTEKGKKNKTNLIFLAGNRVLKYAEKSYITEKSLTALLKTMPEEHVDAVDKIQKTMKRLQKSNLTILRNMAVLIAQNFKSQPDRGSFFSLHNKDGDNEFMNIIANEIGFQDTVIFLTVGEEKGAGLFLIAGPEDIIAALGPQVSELLQGKGSGKGGRFQGKANSLAKRAEAEALVQECSRRHSAGEE